MVNTNGKLTFSISAASLISALGYAAYWGFENLATKTDIDSLHNKLTAQYIELRLTTEEDKLRMFEEKIAKGEELPLNLQRRYDQIKKSVDRLIEERDKLIGAKQ